LTTLLTIFASSFVIALSGALMPGPLLTATITESSRHGFIAGPLMIIGHAVLELVLVAALLLGLAPLFQQPLVFVATALIGSVILFWMAFGMFRSLPSLRLSWEGDQTRRNHPMISGILMSVANPYWDHLVGDDRAGVYSLFLAVWFLGHCVFLCRTYPGRPGLVFTYRGCRGRGEAFSHRPPLPQSHCVLRGLSRSVCRIFCLCGFREAECRFLIKKGAV